MQSIRLFVVEDQPKILKNQLKLLEAAPELEIVGTALSGEEALEELAKMAQKPDVILCDLGLPRMSGIEVTKKVRASYPGTEVLIFTVFDEEEKVIGAIKAGAAGYMLKGAEAHKIVEGIKDVHQGGSVIQPSLARRLLQHFNAPAASQGLRPEVVTQLTKREIECLQMIAKGLSNSEAADVLGLSKATVRTHLEHIYQKLEVSNRVEAVTEGIRQGIIDL
jgi:DNA-binding NarL/FixJ family response regulator